MTAKETSRDLLARCVAARQGGVDFASIWNDLLRPQLDMMANHRAELACQSCHA
jgi:hypothetical protein